MFELVSFSVGIVLLGVVVTLIAAVIILLSVPLLFGRSHNSLSYMTAILFTLILLVFNILFAGLLHSQSQLQEYQCSYQYNLLHKGTSLLYQISPEIAEFADEILLGEDSEKMIEYKLSQISKYLWIDGIICVILFFLAVFVTNLTAQQRTGKYKNHRRSVRRVPTHDDF